MSTPVALFFQQQAASWPIAPPAPPPPLWTADVPPVLQSGPWQCSACSTAWVLRSLGRSVHQDDVVAMLGPRISPAFGLAQGDGSGLVALFAELGLSSDHAWVNFETALALAGTAPMAMGGVDFNHWVAVRGRAADTLLLANPAPGYRGVYQEMNRSQFAQLGPFAAVWVKLT